MRYVKGIFSEHGTTKCYFFYSHIVSQAAQLVTRMSTDTNVNIDEDWKLITILIGGNDLCDGCMDESLYSTENFIKNIADGLYILYNEVSCYTSNNIHIK